STLAVRNLAVSATGAADISRIEALISKDGSKKDLDDELKLTVKKINFRLELVAAKTADERLEIVNKALAGDNAALAEFAWLFSCEGDAVGCAPNPPALKHDVAIKPFAENLFPKRL